MSDIYNENTENKFSLNFFENFLNRWFFSTNHKDIGTLYLIFSILAGFLGTWFSIMIRTELAYPGFQYFNGDLQHYNVIITGHAFIMIVRHWAFKLKCVIGHIYFYQIYLACNLLDGESLKRKRAYYKKDYYNKSIYYRYSEQSIIWTKLYCLNDIFESFCNEEGDEI